MSQNLYENEEMIPELAHIEMLSGSQDGHGLKVALVVARFNSRITENLLAGAHRALLDAGVKAQDINVVWVPGAFELPLLCQKMAEQACYHAVIALGCVIRGDTNHYDYVCQGAARGLMQAGLSTDTPVIFGVLTVDNIDQALLRSGLDTIGLNNNKGAEAARAAIETATLCRHLAAEMAM